MPRLLYASALPAALLLSLLAGCDSTPTDPRTTQQPTQPVTPPVIPPAPPAAAPNTPHDIYVSNADGSGATRLVRGDWPTWSPDSKRIAFQDSIGVAVMNADGSGLVHIAGGTFPAWAPDGARLAYTNYVGIAVVNADGTGNRTLIRHEFRTDTNPASDMGVGKPAWSPDGKQIAFEHLGDGDMQPARIYLMNADGSNPHLLTSDPRGFSYAESDPTWSPDGSRIAFWSYGYGLAYVSAAGGVPTTLYMDFPRVCYGIKPSWSPDGQSIAFSYDPLSSDPSIWTIAVTGGGLKQLIGHGFDAVWSPDRGHIAYVVK